MINLKIDGFSVSVPEKTTILEAAQTVGIEIPTLCYLKEINEIAACRICVVEVVGSDRLVPACATLVEEGMEVLTNSERVDQARKTNLRLILAEHNGNCTMCVRNKNCKLQSLAKDFNILDTPYSKSFREKPWPKSRYLIRDESKCIKCMRCVQVCDKIQGLNIWDAVGSGSRTTVGVSGGRRFEDADCALCGQCITHCPVGALYVRDDTQKVIDALNDPDVITVSQVAPAVRTAWAEELGLSHEEATPARMAAAFKALGFDYVFDTDFSADLTIMEEGSELLGRLADKEKYQWPMFTSCCPGWIRFIKSQYPDFVKNLSSAKSPQQMFGAVVKSYFAEKIGADPHKIFVTSFMPCTAKKFECDESNQNDACGDADVDVVLTTRELSRLLKSRHISVANLKETEFDSPLGEATGAAHIFGASGGVMVAALRSAYYLVTGKNIDPDAFKEIAGRSDWREAVVNIPGAGDVRVAVVSGLKNTRMLMEAIRKGEVSYDFVEVMACPGGCAGGGGQPIHDGEEYAQCRGEILWNIDRNSPVRFSHENRSVQKMYDEYFGKPLGEKSHHLLHTDHTAWNMPLSPKLEK